MESAVIVVLLIILLIIWIMSVQRKLMAMNNNINNAMNQIGVQISSRFDALVSLLDIAKCYAADEAEVLISEIRAGRDMVTAQSVPDDAIKQEELISRTLGKVIRLAECYHGLKEDKGYVRYIDAIDCYEGMILTSYLIYNDSVTKFNRVVLLFPDSLAALALGFCERDYIKPAGGRAGTR